MAQKVWAAERKAQKEREAAQEKQAEWNKERDARDVHRAAWRKREGAERKREDMRTLAGYVKIKEAEERITAESKKHVDLANQLGKLVDGSSRAAAKLIGLNSKSLELREQDNQQILEVLQNGRNGVAVSKEDALALEEKVKANNALSEIQKGILTDMSTGTLTQQSEQDILNKLEEEGVEILKLSAAEYDNIMAEVRGISKGTATLADNEMAELLELAGQTDGTLEKWQGKAKMFGAALKNPALAVTAMKVSVMGLAASFAKDLFDGALKFKQELGLSAGEAAKLSFNVQAASKYTKIMGGDASLIAASATEMVKEFGSTSVFTAAVAKDMADMAISTGFGGAEAAKLLKTMEGISGASIETNINTLEAWGNLAAAEGVSKKLVLEDIAYSANRFARFAKDGGENIAKAAISAAKLGLSLSEVAKISDSLLDIEDSLTKEMEAEMLIGKQLNLDKARELALAGDLEGVMNEIKNIGISQAEWSEMNVIQRQALADSIGVSVADMGKLIAGEQTSAQVAADKAKDKEEADKAALRNQENMMDLMVGIQGLQAGILIIEQFKTRQGLLQTLNQMKQIVLNRSSMGMNVAQAVLEAAKAAFKNPILAIAGIAAAAAGAAAIYGMVSSAKGKGLQEGGVVKETGMAEIHKGEVFSGTKNEMGFGASMAETNGLIRKHIVETKHLREQNELLLSKLIRTTGDLQLANA